ncbi:MAG: hypothetical protein EA406_00460 [Rhodospirillales bacterium]|nr:MAG: hypothetical protein EA406_00460 [Rhodospirillales bacterium]
MAEATKVLGLVHSRSPVAGAEIEPEADEVQRAGGAVDRHGMGRPAVIRHRLLEAGDRRTLGEPIRTQDGDDRVDVGFGEVLAAVGDHERLTPLYATSRR